MIKFKDGCHWYACRNGDPTPQHDADLRIARKEMLYPSITTVLKEEFRNPGLERYAMNQLVQAASENFKMPHEEPEDYANRIYKLSLEHRDKAGEFGTAVHAAIEDYPQYPLDPTLHPWLDKYAEWHKENVDHVLGKELILFDHAIGLAGTCDNVSVGKGKYSGAIILPDYKTQGVKKDAKGRKKPMFYDSWVRQLAFYAVSYAKSCGTIGSIPTCLSVVIDSTEPDNPVIKEWDKQEIIDAYEDVVIAAYRYFKSRDYWPQPAGKIYLSSNIESP